LVTTSCVIGLTLGLAGLIAAVFAEMVAFN